MLAKYPGICAACGRPFKVTEEIKARYTYDRVHGDFIRHPGKWSHKKCPEPQTQRVNPETGEILGVLQYTFDAEPVPFDEALSDQLDPLDAGAAFTRRKAKPRRRPGVGQQSLFEEGLT